LIWNYEADPVGAVFRWVKNKLPKIAKVELNTNYLDTHMSVSIPKEDFEELPSNIQWFLENECNLTILEEEEEEEFST
jgi:adenylate kinase